MDLEGGARPIVLTLALKQVSDLAKETFLCP
jgi:hypothetical protein